MLARLTLLTVFCAGAAQSGGPIAEVVCAPRAAMVQRLTGTYGAHLAATGLRDVETLMEVWASPRGDWTLVQTYVDGQSCILAMGADWDMPDLPDAG